MWYFIPPQLYLYPMSMDDVTLNDMLPALKEILPDEDALLEADEAVAILTLVQGELQDGEPFYAYLAIPPSKYVAFRVAEEKGDYELMDYGEILAFRVGEKEPDEHMKAKIESQYAANHNLEEDLISDVKDFMHESISEAKEKHKKSLLEKYTGRKN